MNQADQSNGANFIRLLRTQAQRLRSIVGAALIRVQSVYTARQANKGERHLLQTQNSGAGTLIKSGSQNQTSGAADLVKVETKDREFLPAALEILKTPPSPIATSMLIFICLAFSSALAWSYFGRIDVYAVAAGKIQPSGRSKVVQPFEAARVEFIHVRNGSRVNVGDVLIDLDPTESSADQETQARDLEGATAETARRKLEISIARTKDPIIRPLDSIAGIPDIVRQREESVLGAEIGQLISTKASLLAQLNEKMASKTRFEKSIAARKNQIELAKELVQMREDLGAKGAGSRALIIEAQQQYETLMVADATDRGQLLEAEAAAQSIERKIEESVTTFIADQSQKLEDAQRKADRLKQEVIKAKSKSERMKLKAPIAGTVQQLAVTTVGQVVAGGQSLLTIVPLEGPVEVEAMIANRDIGFIEIGQKVVVKVEAFPFTRYGTIEGTVTTLSHDAVDERDATNLSDVTTVTKPQGIFSGQPSGPQNLVFPASITLARNYIMIDGKEIPLLAGMTVTAEIKTGQRRVIDFVLSPLIEVTSETSHER